MSGFMATAPIAAPETPAADAVSNDGFFPDLALSQIRTMCRIDGTVTDDRLRDATRGAIAYINRQLATFQATQIAAGKATLADVAADAIDGTNRLTWLYGRAVMSWLQAELLERYRSLDITDAGLRRGLELDPAIGEQRRSSTWAVREMLGLPHTVVELI